MNRVPPPRLSISHFKYNEEQGSMDKNQGTASETTEAVNKPTMETDGLLATASLSQNRSNMSSSSVTPKYRDFRRRPYVYRGEDDEAFEPHMDGLCGILHVARTTLISLCFSLSVVCYSVYQLTAKEMRTTDLVPYILALAVGLFAICIYLINIGVLIPVKYLLSCIRCQTLFHVLLVILSLVEILQKKFILAFLLALHLIPLVMSFVAAHNNKRKKMSPYYDTESP